MDESSLLFYLTLYQITDQPSCHDHDKEQKHWYCTVPVLRIIVQLLRESTYLSTHGLRHEESL